MSLGNTSLQAQDQANVGSPAKLNTGGLASSGVSVIQEESPDRLKIESLKKSRKTPKAAPVRIRKQLTESLESAGAEASKSSGTKSRVGTLPPLHLSARNSVQMHLQNQLDQVANNRSDFSPANFDISRPMNFESRNPGLKEETQNTVGGTALEAPTNEPEAPRHANLLERELAVATRKGMAAVAQNAQSGNKLFESGESLAQIEENPTRLEPAQQFTDAEKAKLSVILSAFSGDGVATKIRAEQERLREEQSKLLNMQQNKDGAAFKYEGLKDEYGHSKFVVYDKRSLFVFGAETTFRNAIVWLTCWPGFDNFIIVMITVNSLFLAAYDYGDRDNLG